MFSTTFEVMQDEKEKHEKQSTFLYFVRSLFPRFIVRFWHLVSIGSLAANVTG